MLLLTCRVPSTCRVHVDLPCLRRLVVFSLTHHLLLKSVVSKIHLVWHVLRVLGSVLLQLVMYLSTHLCWYCCCGCCGWCCWCCWCCGCGCGWAGSDKRKRKSTTNHVICWGWARTTWEIIFTGTWSVVDFFVTCMKGLSGQKYFDFIFAITTSFLQLQLRLSFATSFSQLQLCSVTYNFVFAITTLFWAITTLFWAIATSFL